MTRKHRLLLFFIGAIGAGFVYCAGASNMPPWAQYRGPYGDVIAGLAVFQRHATDTVNAITYDYRGFDTLGEEFILFTSVLGVMLLLRDPKRSRRPAWPDIGLSIATKLTAAGSFFALLVFGLYISTHGQLSPGGGFQGGVILATGSMLIYIAEDFAVFKRITSHPAVEGLDALGAGAYALLGLVPLFLAAPFLTNWIALGTTGNVFSSGTIAAISACVGLEVTAAFLLLGYTYLEDIVSEGAEES